jgi:replication factor C large subunit
MAAWYDLDEAGVAYVTGSGETTNKVQSIVEDAADRRAEAMEDHADGAFAGDVGEGVADASADADANGEASDPETDADVLDRDDADGDDEEASGEEAEDDSQAGLSDFM